MGPSPLEEPTVDTGAGDPLAGDGFGCPLTDEELEAGQAAARAAFPPPAPPQVANWRFAANPLTPLRFEFPGGTGAHYEIPALSYPDGVTLYGLQRQFKSLRSAAGLDQGMVDEATDEVRLRYRAVVLEIVVRLIRLARPIGWRHRLAHAIGRLRRQRPLLDFPAEDVEQLLDHLLGLPDEIQREYPAAKAGTRLPPIDCLRELGIFASHHVTWVDRAGLPISWRHFRIGLLARQAERAMDALAMAQAMSQVHNTKEGAERWEQIHLAAAGLN